MRNIYKALSVAVLGAAVMGSGVASATGTFTVESTYNGITYNDGTYRFSGDGVRLSQSGSTLTCTFGVTGDVVGHGTNTVDMTVTDATSTGSFFSGCSSVSFTTPWTMETMTTSNTPSGDDNSMTTVTVDFYDVAVSSPNGDCLGTVSDVLYANKGSDNRSYFYFNGTISGVGTDPDCHVEGTVYSEGFVDGSTLITPVDVNVYH